MHLTPRRRLLIAISLLLNSSISVVTAQSSGPLDQVSTTFTSSTTTLSSSSLPSLLTRIIPTPPSTFVDVYPTYTQSSTNPTSTNTNNDSDDDGWSGGMSSYYYIFIAIFIVACVFAGWMSHRRRRLRRLRRRNDAQNALLQDSAGWPNNRRWIHGNRTSAGEGRDFEAVRNEGLDERGEAPPPYKPADQVSVRAMDGVLEEGSTVRGEGVISFPPRAADGTKPPDYEARRE